MSEFDKLLQENLAPLQRYVRFKINNRFDADDIIQDVCLTAMLKFSELNNRSSFKPWIISIARNKCNDYYRQKGKLMEIPLDDVSESVLMTGKLGVIEENVVMDTIERLREKDKQILYWYFFKDMSQDEISKQLSVPIGTVKSRLHYAKEKFKQYYPDPKKSKGGTIMKKLPEYLPEYKIVRSDIEPFNVVHEEIPGMFLIPRMGESISFGMYDMPWRKQNGAFELKTIGKIVLHGIEGVSIQKKYSEEAIIEESTVFAQLSDTHCKYLGGIFTDKNGNQKITTFLDSDFDDLFGIGKDNCGFPIHLKPEGRIKHINDKLVMPLEADIFDMEGRFLISINGAEYDTVRLIDYEIGNQGGMLCEYYLDQNGRTILWRRFNKNDWAYKRYGELWTDMLPENETLNVNGETYVHWYDCITDYIL